MARRTLPILKQLPHLGLGPTRTVTYMPRPGDGAPRTVTLIPGDGIGPLVTNAVEQVMQAMQAPVYFERYEVHGDMKSVPQEVFELIRKNKVCLKGGLRTPVGGGVSSLNVQLRKELWQRYVDWLYQHKELGLYLDVSRVGFTDEFVAEMEPRFQSAFRAMEELEKG